LWFENKLEGLLGGVVAADTLEKIDKLREEQKT